MPTISEILSTAIEHHQAGRLEEAEQAYRQILQSEPNHADAIHLLGYLAHQVGRNELAVELIVRAIELKGNVPAFHNNLGEAYRALRKISAAVACYRRALRLKPDYPEALNNLGITLNDQGQFDQAVASLRQALALKPDFALAHNNLGTAFQTHGQLDEAVNCFRRAVELQPDYALAYNNLGAVLRDQGRLTEAVACCRRATELLPGYAEAYNNLGNALGIQGQLDEALIAYRRALELKPEYAEAHSNLLYTLHFVGKVTPTELVEAHAEYDRQHAVPLLGATPPRAGIRDRHARLRVGFVSPDLGRHPVGFFLVRVLENLKDQPLETICYSDRVFKDDMTQRLQAAATEWRDVPSLSHEQLAEQIRADRIDILFDLAGHTAHNRLLVFARKPAPIQVTWIGYEGTTGLGTMDYLLADRHVVPEGSERYHRERVLRLPDGYLCYDPPASAPPVGPPPLLKNGFPTFGSFNKLTKLTPDVIAVWSDILRRVPAARLVLKYRGLGDETVRQRYLDLFAAHGVEPHRLDLLPPSSYEEYLTTYHQVDVVLDPFPFSGSTTTCEALWMGVPVVTCPFETFASRHSLSHLSTVGLTETIARDLDEYVELAVSLAGELPRLTALRADLRERMAASPLCDGKRFAGNLVTILRELAARHHLTEDVPR
jgi:predicted O-linked N-acetylglucosamine transferase (SPINDLY family)